MFFGPLANPENKHLKDLNKRELLTALPFVVLVIVMGLKPQPVLDVLEPSSNRYVARALWASDDKNAKEAQVKSWGRPLPGAEGRPVAAPGMDIREAPRALGTPLVPTLRQMPPRIMQAPVPVKTP